VWCVATLYNAALNRPAFQSSTRIQDNGIELAANLANDGDLGTNATRCAATRADVHPW